MQKIAGFGEAWHETMGGVDILTVTALKSGISAILAAVEHIGAAS